MKFHSGIEKVEKMDRIGGVCSKSEDKKGVKVEKGVANKENHKNKSLLTLSRPLNFLRRVVKVLNNRGKKFTNLVSGREILEWILRRTDVCRAPSSGLRGAFTLKVFTGIFGGGGRAGKSDFKNKPETAFG